MSPVAPQFEWDVRCSVREVLVRGQQSAFIATAKLNGESVYGADLDAISSACVSDLRGAYVILPVWLDQRQCSKALHDRVLCLRPAETLEQLLQDQTGSDYRIGSVQRLAERDNLSGPASAIAPKRERPYAGVYK